MTRRLSAELEQAWLLLENKDRELEAVHDQSRKLREMLARETERRLQLENGNHHHGYPSRMDHTAVYRSQSRPEHAEISQLKEALQVLGEQLEGAHRRIMELSNQQTVVRGEKPHLVSNNATIRRNRSA